MNVVRVEPHLADESLNLSRACDRFPENLLFIINCCEENVYDEYFLFLDFGGSPFNLNLSSVSGVMYFWPMRSRRRSTDNSKYRVIFFSGKFYRSRFAFIFFRVKNSRDKFIVNGEKLSDSPLAAPSIIQMFVDTREADLLFSKYRNEFHNKTATGRSEL